MIIVVVVILVVVIAVAILWSISIIEAVHVHVNAMETNIITIESMNPTVIVVIVMAKMHLCIYYCFWF